MAQKKKKNSLIKNIKDMDKILLIFSLIIIIFGAINIVTASSREAVVNMEKSVFYYFVRHLVMLFAGFICSLILIKTSTKKYNKFLIYIYIIVLIGNILAIIIGKNTRGASNWLPLGPVSIQPSEFAKPVLIVGMSILFQKCFKKLKTTENKKERATIIAIILIPFLFFPALAILQKDMGTAIILLGIYITLIIFSPILKSDKRQLLLIGAIGVALIFFVSYLTGSNFLTKTQLSRLTTFYNPCSKYEDTGYQVCNAFIAINNGGIKGVGLGSSTQKYSYIPEPHTDMIFAIISEETGLIGCSIIFFIYIVILFRILSISKKTNVISHRYICIGTAAYIFLHIFINLGGLFGIIPLTGVPLPFLSYGGSFTISLLIMLAIVQRIEIERKNEKIKVNV